MDGEEVHAVLRVGAHRGEKVLSGELHERLLHVANGVVHGDGAHHERRALHELLAEEAGLAGVGEVHDGVRTVLLGRAYLLPLHAGVRHVPGDAEVDVDLGGEARAHAARHEALLEVANVDRDGDASRRHARADELRVSALRLRHDAHLGRDLPSAGVVELRDEALLAARCLPAQFLYSCAHAQNSLRWHYPCQVPRVGAGAPPLSLPSCKLPALCGCSGGAKSACGKYSAPLGRVCARV